MSYTPDDAAWDEAYDNMSRELYPEHKRQAIEEFREERFRSYYLSNPDVLAPATRAFKESKALLEAGHHAAALVFAASATELFLKGSLLRPVVHGLVSESFAELVVEAALSQSGFRRYEKLLAGLFSRVAGIELSTLEREGAKKNLLAEASDLYDLRNRVVHGGQSVSEIDGKRAVAIATEVFAQILAKVLEQLNLGVESGKIVDYSSGEMP